MSTHTQIGRAGALMGLSGAAALAWQMLWTAQWGRVLGHEIVAVLGVVAAIFAGMAAGAALLGRRIEASRQPARWYAGLEALLGLWGLALLAAGPQLIAALPALLGPQPPVWQHWLWAFGLPGALLLPCSAAMGASLPALLGALRQRAPADLSLLYAANTAGAVAGVLATTFGLIPLLGLTRTGLLAAGLNLLCAVAAGLLWRRPTGEPVQMSLALSPASALVPVPVPVPVPAQAATPVPAPASSSAALVLLAATGLLGIGVETLCVRVLSQVTENTVYSYALLLAVFLTGTALGAGWQARRDAHHTPAQAVRRLLSAMPAALLLGGLGLWWADLLVLGPTRWWGGGTATALLGETLAALAALLAPTLVMGALFSAACRQAQAAGLALGRAIAVNTLAAACAPALVGLWLLPQLGAARAWLLLVLGYGALAVWRLERRRDLAVLCACSLAALAAAGLPELRFVDPDPNARLLWFRDGVMGTVSITADARGIKHLRINNRIQEGSSASSPLETRLALLPLLTHAQPHQALFLGLGTGATAHVAAQVGGLEVDVVELLPEVVEASRLFMAEPTAPHPQRPPHVMTADARRFVQATARRYDVIVADLFHPARSGAGALYTVEHFEAVRRRLAPGGVFCQWVALHQMELATFDSIVAAFALVYPEGQILLASNSLDSPVLGLWASADGARPRLDQVAQALARSPAELQPRLQQARLSDAYAVLGSWLGSVQTWRARSPAARPNRDDLPLVAHLAPWDDYAPQHTPRQRLAAVLARLGRADPGLPPDPSTPDDPVHPVHPVPLPGLLAADTAPEQAQALADYCRARDRYLQLGLTLEREADPQRLLARLEPALSELQRLSPRFGPAIDALATLRSAAATAAEAAATSGAQP